MLISFLYSSKSQHTFFFLRKKQHKLPHADLQSVHTFCQLNFCFLQLHYSPKIVYNNELTITMKEMEFKANSLTWEANQITKIKIHIRIQIQYEELKWKAEFSYLSIAQRIACHCASRPPSTLHNKDERALCVSLFCFWFCVVTAYLIYPYHKGASTVFPQEENDFFYIEVQLISNVVLITTVQQSDSVIYISSPRIPSHYSFLKD